MNKFKFWSKGFAWGLGIAVFATCLAFGLSAIGTYPGNVGQVGVNALIQNSPLATQTYSGGITGSGKFTVSTTGSYYLSSGGTSQTSVPCNWVTLSVSTSNAFLSTSGTSALSVPAATMPLTLSCSNLNTLQVSGTGAVIGYLYGN